MQFKHHMFFARPSSLDNRLIESSYSPMRLISPLLIVLNVPVKWPWSFIFVNERPMDAWSLTWMIRFEAVLVACDIIGFSNL